MRRPFGCGMMSVVSKNAFVAFATVVASMTVSSGCSRLVHVYPAPRAFEFEPVAEPTRSWALAIADEHAKTVVLANYNSGPRVARDGGPFTLDQYSRDISRITNEAPAGMNLIVRYQLQVPVLFDGHPQHFSILVRENDGTAAVFDGI